MSFCFKVCSKMLCALPSPYRSDFGRNLAESRMLTQIPYVYVYLRQEGFGGCGMSVGEQVQDKKELGDCEMSFGEQV